MSYASRARPRRSRRVVHIHRKSGACVRRVIRTESAHPSAGVRGWPRSRRNAPTAGPPREGCARLGGARGPGSRRPRPTAPAAPVKGREVRRSRVRLRPLSRAHPTSHTHLDHLSSREPEVPQHGAEEAHGQRPVPATEGLREDEVGDRLNFDASATPCAPPSAARAPHAPRAGPPRSARVVRGNESMSGRPRETASAAAPRSPTASSRSSLSRSAGRETVRTERVYREERCVRGIRAGSTKTEDTARRSRTTKVPFPSQLSASHLPQPVIAGLLEPPSCASGWVGRRPAREGRRPRGRATRLATTIPRRTRRWTRRRRGHPGEASPLLPLAGPRRPFPPTAAAHPPPFPSPSPSPLALASSPRLHPPHRRRHQQLRCPRSRPGRRPRPRPRPHPRYRGRRGRRDRRPACRTEPAPVRGGWPRRPPSCLLRGGHEGRGSRR